MIESLRQQVLQLQTTVQQLTVERDRVLVERSAYQNERATLQGANQTLALKIEELNFQVIGLTQENQRLAALIRTSQNTFMQNPRLQMNSFSPEVKRVLDLENKINEISAKTDKLLEKEAKQSFAPTSVPFSQTNTNQDTRYGLSPPRTSLSQTILNKSPSTFERQRSTIPRDMGTKF
eukprot:TRINITY_DN12922_c0_g2_i3.p1 TRINITY_DN12922_c0_g2~~TRINITY_DN12922_c0_g2_i3.p1  ORF type:complete len:178 (-),score=26.90 TRINITY_DN12922_c0_g2_i3:88-621(-)